MLVVKYHAIIFAFLLISYSWLNNDGYYNPKFSSKTNILSSAFSSPATWAITYSGIPGYKLTLSADDITALNTRPEAATDFTTGATTAAVGDVIELGDDIGYSSTSCTLGYWPVGPDCPTQSNRCANYNLTPRPETSSGNKSLLHYYQH